MHTSYISQHIEVAKFINEAVTTERIYLLGYTVSQVRTHSIFNTDAPTARPISHYYVLVLVQNQTLPNGTLQDKIESHCRSFVDVTAIVLNLQQYSEWLNEGHPFACKVAAMAECMYNAGNTLDELPAPGVQQSTGNETSCQHGLHQVQEFLAGAQLYMIRKENRMASFMLHQAAEQALGTLLRLTTGLYVNTHNIDRLVRYCSMTSPRIPAVFPRNNEKNERLFRLLQKAYINSRYKQDYCIKTDELLTLSEWVKALEQELKVTCNTFKDQIQ